MLVFSEHQTGVVKGCGHSVVMCREGLKGAYAHMVAFCWESLGQLGHLCMAFSCSVLVFSEHQKILQMGVVKGCGRFLLGLWIRECMGSLSSMHMSSCRVLVIRFCRWPMQEEPGLGCC